MLLDTDVMIDIVRGHPPAAAWLASLGGAPLDLPGLVVLELLQGCQNLSEQRRVEQAVDQLFADVSRHGLSDVTFRRNIPVEVPGLGPVVAPILAEGPRGARIFGNDDFNGRVKQS